MAQVPLGIQVRRFTLPILRKINPGEIRLRHHWTGTPIHIDSFKHKGYWFHGRERERASLVMAASLLRPGDVVIEAGGHIGYLTEFFRAMVGAGGRCDVYEPDPDNRRYLLRNTRNSRTVRVFSSALAGSPGRGTLFTEQLTGQNSSLIEDYEGLLSTFNASGIRPEVLPIEVQLQTLDAAYASDSRVDFIKIDVEGAELDVLRGGQLLLQRLKPALLLEVSRHHEETYELLGDLGYVVFAPDAVAADRFEGNQNYFALHPHRHAIELQGLGLSFTTDQVDL